VFRQVRALVMHMMWVQLLRETVQQGEAVMWVQFANTVLRFIVEQQ
jgi:hypothetical protein